MLFIFFILCFSETASSFMFQHFVLANYLILIICSRLWILLPVVLAVNTQIFIIKLVASDFTHSSVNSLLFVFFYY